MRALLFLEACFSVMSRRILARNDWRVLAVLLLVTGILAGPLVVLLSAGATLFVFVVLDMGALPEIMKEYEKNIRDYMNR